MSLFFLEVFGIDCFVYVYIIDSFVHVYLTICPTCTLSGGGCAFQVDRIDWFVHVYIIHWFVYVYGTDLFVFVCFQVLGVLVKLVVLIGSFAAAFGPAYSFTLVHLLYGSRCACVYV